ncbi:unannotated protein [freshwater metagenome]|uniref:Unannotated protein n=1 Tax=freshwater metagenome TaxID=449393 RepID=A0A6J6CYH3_9ZZZZ|nr:hypothetical protein [Actinomycetota bacterium]
MSDPGDSLNLEGETMKLPFTVAIALGIVLSGVSPAHAETDPFPGVEHMGEIPGTRISSPAWSQQAEWESTATYQNYLALGCPEGSGRAIAVDVAVMVWSNYCVKTWRSQAVIRAWEKYYSDEAEGRALAYEQSLAWNKANPGKQKCFSYGPLTSPDGGTTSGGVCANPVAAEDAMNIDPNNDEIQSDSFNKTEPELDSERSQVSRDLEPASQILNELTEGDSLKIFPARFLNSLPRG